MARYDEALALAMAALADEPDADGEVNGCMISPVEIAAHLLAVEADRLKSKPATTIARLLPDARDAVQAIASLTTPERCVAWQTKRNGLNTRASGTMEGKLHRRGWTVNGRNVQMWGNLWHISAAVGGLHKKLPAIAPDHAAIERAFRKGLSNLHVLSQLLRIDIETTPYQYDADMLKTQIVVHSIMEPLCQKFEIHNMAHRSKVENNASINQYVRSTYHMLTNAETLLKQMASSRVAVEEQASTSKPPIKVGGAILNSVSTMTHPTLGQDVVFHVGIQALGNNLLPEPSVVVCMGKLGMSEVRPVDMKDQIEQQNRRASFLRRRGGMEMDETAYALMVSRGHDADELLRKAIQNRYTTADVDNVGKGDTITTKDGRFIFKATLSKKARWVGNLVELKMRLPDIVMIGMAGRSLRSVVDHPAFEDAIIRRAFVKNGMTNVQVEHRWRRV